MWKKLISGKRNLRRGFTSLSRAHSKDGICERSKAIFNASYEASQWEHRHHQQPTPLNLGTITIPSISTGIYRYPLREAAEIAISTLAECSKTKRNYVFVCFDQTTFEAYQSAITSNPAVLRGEWKTPTDPSPEDLSSTFYIHRCNAWLRPGTETRNLWWRDSGSV